MPFSPTNPVTKEGVALGRYLFYDPILSSDSNLSCASCHNQHVAFSDAPNTFSKGKNGQLQKRNTLPLFNLAWYPSLFWDGRAHSIEQQVFQPVTEPGEMDMKWVIVAERLKRSKFYVDKFRTVFGDQKIDSFLIAKAIGQFERTLISYRSKYDKVLARKASFTKDEADGFVLMNDMTKGDCLHCHTTDADPLGTTLGFSNNGLDAINDPLKFNDIGKGKVSGNINDYGKFKIPSLRNVAFTSPYMHDGRFKTLKEVLDFYSEGLNQSVNIDSKMEFVHQKGVRLTEIEKNKIIAFLLTLSDSDFVTDESLSNPFTK